MNKPYVFNYQAPINSMWKSTVAETTEGSGDLDHLLKQAHEDLSTLGETVLRLDENLRTAKIDKVVTERKIEVISNLIQEVAALRRNASAETVQNAAQEADAANAVDTMEKPKRKRRPKTRKTTTVLLIIVILVLAGTSLLVFATHTGNVPWLNVRINDLTTWLQPFASRFFH